jgi:DNA-binding NarL/FixJ family response regulator
MNKVSRIVLASGSRLLLEGMRKILESGTGLKVVAEVFNSREVQKSLDKMRPEFLFLDNRTPDLDIHKLLDFMNKKGHETKVILFGNEPSESFCPSNVIYINKETDSSELIKIIKSTNYVASTETAINDDGEKHNITRMERRVAELIEEGLSNKEISYRLSIREKTVKAHITSIFKKLGFRSRYQLMVMNGRQLRRIAR